MQLNILILVMNFALEKHVSEILSSTLPGGNPDYFDVWLSAGGVVGPGKGNRSADSPKESTLATQTSSTISTRIRNITPP